MAKPVHPIGTVKVLHDYTDPENQGNKVVAGDSCNLLNKDSAEWWYVAKIGSVQPSKPLYVPANYVKLENKVPPKCAPKPSKKPPREAYMNVTVLRVKDSDDNANENKRNSVRDLATNFEIKQQSTEKTNALQPPSALSKASSTDKLAAEPKSENAENLKDGNLQNSVDEKEKNVSNNEEHVVSSQDVESQADSGIDNHEGHIDESSLMSSSGDSLDLLEDGKNEAKNTATIDSEIPAPDYDDDDEDDKDKENDEDEEVMYANVDPEAKNKTDDLPEYANLEEIQNAKKENPPVPDATAKRQESTEESQRGSQTTSTSSAKNTFGTCAVLSTPSYSESEFSNSSSTSSRSKDDNRLSTYSSGSLPRGWLEDKGDDGEVFYINETTNEKWLSSIDSSGKRYYYNEHTSVSSWELPEADTEANEKQDDKDETQQEAKDDTFKEDVGIPYKAWKEKDKGNAPRHGSVDTMLSYSEKKKVENKWRSSSLKESSRVAIGPSGVSWKRNVGPETVTEEEDTTAEKNPPMLQKRSQGKETIPEEPDVHQKATLKTKPSLSRTLSHPDSLTPKRSVSPLMSQRASMLLQSVVGAKDWDHFLRNSFANLGVTEKSGVVYKGKISEKGKEFKVKSWEKCFLMTKGQYLCVFKKINNKSNYSEDKADQKIDLKGASITFFGKNDRHKKASILVKGDVDFIFYCEESKEAIHEWNCALKNNVEYFGANSTGEQETDDKQRVSSEGNGEPPGRKRWRFLEPFFKTRPTVESIRKKGIYKDPVFGSTLQEISDREKSTIPLFVRKCIQEIERKGLSSDGIYRVPGNMALVQSIRCEVDQNEKFDLNHTDWDINALAGSLKLFFRELREPLFPSNMYDQFLNAIKLDRRSDRIDALKKQCKALPKVNRETLKLLLEHLIRVESHKLENRMEFHNIAIVFGPTLMQPATFGLDLASSLVLQNQVVELLLIEYKAIY